MALDKSHLLMLTVTLQAAMEENVGLSQAMEAKDKEIAELKAGMAARDAPVPQDAVVPLPPQPNGGKVEEASPRQA